MNCGIEAFGSNFQSDPICFLQVAATSALAEWKGFGAAAGEPPSGPAPGFFASFNC